MSGNRYLLGQVQDDGFETSSGIFDVLNSSVNLYAQERQAQAQLELQQAQTPVQMQMAKNTQLLLVAGGLLLFYMLAKKA